MPRLPLLILGAGIWAEEVADVACDAGFEVEGFVENMDRERAKSQLDGRPIYWIDDSAQFSDTHLVISGIGTTHRDRYVRQAADLGFGFATVVHPTARISSRSTVGSGSFVNAGVIIATKTTIGRHVNLNRGCLIGHHTNISDFSSIQPGARVGGVCLIGPRTWVGIGATIIDRITIGAGSIVAAGAVVTKDLPDSVLAMGIPAEIVREGVDAK